MRLGQINSKLWFALLVGQNVSFPPPPAVAIDPYLRARRYPAVRFPAALPFYYFPTSDRCFTVASILLLQSW